jgi:hypothetical protein
LLLFVNLDFGGLTYAFCLLTVTLEVNKKFL